MSAVQSLVLTGTGVVEVVGRESRELPAGHVRLAVEAAGICGSDVHGFAGHNDRRPIGVVMGHESIGRVVECSAGAALPLGARVAVNPVVACGSCRACVSGSENLCAHRRLYGCFLNLDGGLATEMIVDATNCVVIDGDADLRGLALIEPMSVGTHAVSISGARDGDRAVIIGAGPIGIAVYLACVSVDRGLDILICEPQPERRRVAERLGASTCTPDELTAEAAADIVFECVGLRATMRSAVDAVRTGGSVVCLGIGEPTLEVSTPALVIEERRLLGSSAYTRQDFLSTAQAVTQRASELAQLVELVVDLDGMPAVFESYAAGTLTALKTLYIPGGR